MPRQAGANRRRAGAIAKEDRCPFLDWPELRLLPAQTAERWQASWTQNYYQRGDILFYQGNAPTGLYFAGTGRVKLVHGRGYCRQQVVRMVCAPGFLGERSLLLDAPYEATAQVVEDSRVHFLSADRFRGLWETEPVIAKLFARLLAKTLGQVQGELVSMGSHTIRERLARLIARGQEQSRRPGEGFVIAQSRQELAEMLATSPEVICRTMGDFEHKGLIDIDGRLVRVLDRRRLLQVARLPHEGPLTFVNENPISVKSNTQNRRA